MSNNTNEQDSQNLNNTNTTEKDNNTNDKINSSSPINIPPVANSELEAINKKDKNSQKPTTEKTNPKIEIPQRKNNYNYDDTDDLIDLSNEIEMITDEIKETYYDDLLNKQDMSLFILLKVYMCP